MCSDRDKRMVEQSLREMAKDYQINTNAKSNDSTTKTSNVNDEAIASGISSKVKKSAIDFFYESLGESMFGEINTGEDADQRTTIVEDVRTYMLTMSKFIVKHKLDESSASSFWAEHGKAFPTLGHLARRLLCVMATSVPSESAFLFSAFLGRKERARLSEENLALSLFLEDKVAL